MSQENVEAVRRVYERWGEGDFHAAVDLFDPTCSWYWARSSPRPEHISAPRQSRPTRVACWRSWTHLTMEAEAIVAAGDSVLVDVRQRGAGRASGVPTEAGYFTLWSFRGRKVIRIESFGERSEALEAAGLSE
jgi:ketosteroid isomerase-like protein